MVKLKNSWSLLVIRPIQNHILFGAEYIPDKFSNYSYLKRIEYRIGGHIEDNYLIINGEQVKEYGVSVGIGLPMRRTVKDQSVF